jgi:hypothetical protein
MPSTTLGVHMRTGLRPCQSFRCDENNRWPTLIRQGMLCAGYVTATA